MVKKKKRIDYGKQLCLHLGHKMLIGPKARI